MKSELSTGKAPSPFGAYSQGIVANGFVFTSGFGPTNPETGDRPEGVRDQTRQALQNVEAVLREYGLDLTDVVKATVHLQNLKRDFGEFNRAYGEMMPSPRPVRTTVGSDLYDILVEIDVVAALRG